MRFAIKVCLGLFVFRLSSTPLFFQVLWAMVWFRAASTLATWLLYALQCRPLKAFYAPNCAQMINA